MAHIMKEFYTTSEFAEFLSVDKRTVIKLIKAGKLNAVNISSGNKPSYRILCKEYLRFISEENNKRDEDGEVDTV